MLLTNAILHIVGNSEAGTRLSRVELDVDSEACFEFVGRHARRLLRAPAAKEATFRAESQVYALIQAFQRGELHFKELSWKLCQRLAEILQANKDIPPADLLIAAFDQSDKRYLAIVKLACGECFTHRVVERDGVTETQLVKNVDMLSLSASKVEEACLIPFDPLILRVVERPHPIGEEMVPYFSQLFLECDTEMSKEEAAGIIQDVAEQVNREFFEGDVEMEAKLKAAVVEAAAQDKEEPLNLEGAVRSAFADREEAADRFLEQAREAGLPREVMLDKSYVERKFRHHTIRADNGVEIKIPLEIAQNPETVQIVQGQDGTFTITLRHLRSKAE